MFKLLRTAFGIRTTDEHWSAGVAYVQKQIAIHGTDNTEKMQMLWMQCSPSFDNHPFDRGMSAELTRQRIPHPAGPY